MDIFCGIENVDRENPFPLEYDVDAASEYKMCIRDRPITLINPAWQLPGSGLLRMEKNTISSAIPPWQRAGRR